MPPDLSPLAATLETSARARTRPGQLQKSRRAAQAVFFLLFVLAPALNLLRFDLYDTQLWFMGMRWSLGIGALASGEINATQAGISILLRAFLPAIVFVTVFLGIAYRYGRLYCGWLCPHFSAVELLNNFLHRASGKLSLWDRGTTPRVNVKPKARWWPLFALSCALMGFLWAITLLTYLLPPTVIWGGLIQGTLTPNQTRFIVIGSLVLTAEFAFARHLFCRFGCAVGLFQSLAWMANPRGMVVAFARDRARDCKTCDPPRGSACDNACPMRLNPRNIKRLMFSCVQCGQCLSACDTSQQAQAREPTLQWQVGVEALRETLRQRRREHSESS
ncbi:MAG: 4Fe-4S binding protein [Polaromonas sp.]|uniref:4Fe-4S binding protein n=1 Tax=Polaromonas sp. TaxID=1869339 RepID=UPI0027311CB0|nr:4Fe-4S binding protein [Polaromonas sp.]MDP3706513.1 4Fe-4S binding protein [Polaromonas sp.]